MSFGRRQKQATMTSTILRLPRARAGFLQTRIERYAKFDSEINTVILISKFDVQFHGNLRAF